MHFTITVAIIIITALISIGGFSNQKIVNDLIFYPPAISQRKQWYRFITCGFIHADTMHLLFNMYSLYMFGGIVEEGFDDIFGQQSPVMYITMYVTALIACLLPTYLAHKENQYYSSLGASGAIAAVVFAFIFLNPTLKMYLLFLPIPLPAFVFGVLYLVVSSVLAKRGGSHINHSAHFWGSIYGVFFLIVTAFAIAHRNLLSEFADKLLYYFRSF